MKTTLSSVYFGMGSEMANETNPSPEKSVALLTLMQAYIYVGLYVISSY
jgi:hypothetical protein